jgi:putative insertion element HTH domain-containing protein
MAVEVVATNGDKPANARKPLTLKAAFVTWLFAPESEREQKTMLAWADAHGVSRQTLWEWKNQDEDVLAMLAEWKRLAEASRPAVVGALIKVATDPDHPAVVQAIRTYAELTDMFPDKKLKIEGEIRHTVTGLYGAAAAIEGEYQEEDERAP